MVKIGIVEGRWMPCREGDYSVQCQRGREYAEAVLQEIGATGNPTIFGTVIRAMIGSGVYEAIEVGFCSRLGIQIFVDAQLAEAG